MKAAGTGGRMSEVVPFVSAPCKKIIALVDYELHDLLLMMHSSSHGSGDRTEVFSAG